MLKTNFQYELNKKIVPRFKIKKSKIIQDNPCEKKQGQRGPIKALSYQELVKYLIVDENLRGLLVYFGLGSGKTYTALKVAEAIPKKTVIISPASISYIFIQEIRKYFPEKYPENDIKPLKKKYEFVSYNAPNIMAQYEKLSVDTDKNNDLNKKQNIINLIKNIQKNKFDNKLIIIDEAHAFFQAVVSAEAKQALKLFNKMVNSRGSKFLFLTGTPVIGSPFEMVPMFNILKGPLYDGKKVHTLFPNDYTKFMETFVENNTIKNKDIFQDRITGMVCYYRGFYDENQDVIPAKLPMVVVKTPMSDQQASQYALYRLQEIEVEMSLMKGKRKQKEFTAYKKAAGSKGSYKMKSRQLCNFSFPPDLEKKYKEFVEKNKDLSQQEISKYRLDMVNNLEDDYLKGKQLYNLSNKYYRILDIIQKSPKENIFLYSVFATVGLRTFARVLEANGWASYEKHLLDPKKTPLKKGKTFAIIDGYTDHKTRARIIPLFNSPENAYGDSIRVLLGSYVVAAGFSFFNIQKVIITEPQWRMTTISQVIGRPIRLCSHSALPKKLRKVKPYLFISTLPDNLKPSFEWDKGRTSDEMLFDLAKSLDILNNSFLDAMKENSIDCETNKAHNIDVKTCRVCKPTDKPLIYPNIDEHLIMGSSCRPLESEVDITLKEVMYQGKKYYMDPATRKVYTYIEEKKGYRLVGKYENNTVILF